MMRLFVQGFLDRKKRDFLFFYFIYFLSYYFWISLSLSLSLYFPLFFPHFFLFFPIFSRIFFYMIFSKFGGGGGGIYRRMQRIGASIGVSSSFCHVTSPFCLFLISGPILRSFLEAFLSSFFYEFYTHEKLWMSSFQWSWPCSIWSYGCHDITLVRRVTQS